MIALRSFECVSVSVGFLWFALCILYISHLARLFCYVFQSLRGHFALSTPASSTCTTFPPHPLTRRLFRTSTSHPSHPSRSRSRMLTPSPLVSVPVCVSIPHARVPTILPFFAWIVLDATGMSGDSVFLGHRALGGYLRLAGCALTCMHAGGRLDVAC